MDLKKIYFDMDGVLANFDGGIRELCGREPLDQNQNRSPEEDNKLWESVKKVERFYDKLKPMPGAEELFRKVHEAHGDKCEILTGIPKPRRGILTAGEDKINWVRRILSKDVKVNIVYREEKPNYCTGKDCILIDDYKKNIREWEEMGGTGILFTTAEEVTSRLKELGVL